MSYSNISGLDLFQTPFRQSRPARQQASGQKVNGQATNAADLQPKTEASATQQPKPVASSSAQQPKPAAPLSAQHKRPETSAVLSHQTDTASRADLQPNPSVSEEKQQPLQTEATAPEEKAVSAQLEETGRKEADKVPEQNQDVAQELQKTLADTETSKQTEQQKELVLDMSTGDTVGNPLTEDDQEKRKAHEAAEAKRKAEWEAKQREKKQKEEAELQKLQNMTDDEAIAASIGRVKTDVERLTRRNMKECVAEHISELCQRDACFARLTMHPRKSMINCFKYINRKARDYVKQEMEDNDIKPDRDGCYGSDVPDGLCYQWAAEYFLNPDQEKQEKFVERPYIGSSSKPKKAASKAKKADKPAKKESKENQETASNGYEQMTLGV